MYIYFLNDKFGSWHLNRISIPMYHHYYYLLFLEILIQAGYKGCKRRDKDVGRPLSLLFFTVNQVQVCK